MTKSFWDERYESEAYVYGKAPNRFLKKCLKDLKPGKILFPGEGEGRNAVFAAKCGWDVTAFDSSIEGRKKALKLAEVNGVSINYLHSDYLDFKPNEKFDAIGLFFTHMPEDMRPVVHNRYVDFLKPGGRIIVQGFRKEQLGLSSGGPKEVSMLFSAEDLRRDFTRLNSVQIEEMDDELSEGPFHQGFARLVTLIGIK